MRPPGMDPADLPPVDCVLISHYGAFFKEPVAEIEAVRRVMDAHPLRDQVRILPVGGAATFLY